MDQNDIREMIDANLAAKAEYDRLVFDELTDRGDPGPAGDAAIAAAERALGQPLPASYRALLQVRNGILYFDGDSHILAAEDLSRDWVARECAAKTELFIEFEGGSPFARGAIPVMIGEDSNALLLWLPDGDGGGTFVEYDIVEQVGEYETLFDYIRDDTDLVREMADEEAGG